MTLLLRNALSFNSVGANQTATLKLPVNQTYTATFIQVLHGAGATPMSRASMEEHIVNVRLMTDRDLRWDISGADLLRLNDFYGVPFQNGILPMIYVREWMQNPALADNFALGTADLDEVTIEVTLSSTVDSPRLSASHRVMVEANRPLGQIVELKSNGSYNAPAAGWFEVPSLPVVGPNIGLSAMHITSDRFSEVDLRLSGQPIYESRSLSLAKQVTELASHKTVRNWVDGWWHIDFAGDRYRDIQSTSGATAFLLRVNAKEQTTFNVIHEVVVGNAIVQPTS